MASHAFVSWKKVDGWLNKALKISSTTGAFLTLFYFLKIRSMPIDGIESLAGLAAAVALVSIMLFVGLSLSWGLPGIIFQLWVESDDESITSWFLVQPAVGVKQPWKSSAIKIFLWCVAMVACPWILFISYADPKLLGGGDTIWPVQAISIICVISIVALYVGRYPSLAIRSSSNEANADESRWYGSVKRFALCSVFLIANAWPLFAFLQSISLSEAIKQSAEHWSLEIIFGGIAFAMLLNFFSIAASLSKDKHDLNQRIAVHMIVIAVTLAMGITLIGGWGSWLDRVMAVVSVRTPEAKLIMTKEGCDALKVAGLMSADQDNSNGCMIGKMTILSRLGGYWPLECESGADDSGRLLVKSDTVVHVMVNGKKPLPQSTHIKEVNLCHSS
jgi:hypothetical protein